MTETEILKDILKSEIEHRASIASSLTHLQERSDALINSVPWLVAWISNDLTYIEANASYASLLQATPEQLVGATLGTASLEQEIVSLISQLRDSKENTLSVEASFIKDNKNCSFILTASYLEYCESISLVGQDISEIKNYQLQLEGLNKTLDKKAQARAEELTRSYEKLNQTKQHLIQSEKMACIGTMAAGIAHEINNPVGYIRSNLQYLEEVIKEYIELKNLPAEYTDEITEIVSSCIDGTTRITEIITNLKDFSRIDKSNSQTSDLQSCITQAVALSNNELKYKTEVKISCPSDHLVVASPSELKQVLLNLILNAVHAIDQFGAIELESRELDDFICLSIKDTGKGISKKNLAKIFDPFFTTKPEGEGTGLGLFICHGIVKRYGGTIEVYSEEGTGTEFRIYLRRATCEQYHLENQPRHSSA